VQLEGGFKPDTIYEITYVAKDPYVTGAGLAGIRDLLSYFRDHPFEGAPAPRNVLMFGISQSGRLIGRMMPMASMSMKAASWYSTAPTCKCRAPAARQASTAASPSRPHPSMMEEHDYPADAFPFTSTPTRDPATGKTRPRWTRRATSKAICPSCSTRILPPNSGTVALR
jgi:hypothetical protein